MGIIFYLHPFSAKLTKKLLKKPKLYFYDTGLLCHLLNIDNVDKLMGHKNLGNIFET
jgi:predicted AAA+ superfamily ATPase